MWSWRLVEHSLLECNMSRCVWALADPDLVEILSTTRESQTRGDGYSLYWNAGRIMILFCFQWRYGLSGMLVERLFMRRGFSARLQHMRSYTAIFLIWLYRCLRQPPAKCSLRWTFWTHGALDSTMEQWPKLPTGGQLALCAEIQRECISVIQQFLSLVWLILLSWSVGLPRGPHSSFIFNPGYGNIIREISSSASDFQACTFLFEGRKSNVKTHSLAKHALRLSEGCHVWLVQPPGINCISINIVNDQ